MAAAAFVLPLFPQSPAVLPPDHHPLADSIHQPPLVKLSETAAWLTLRSVVFTQASADHFPGLKAGEYGTRPIPMPVELKEAAVFGSPTSAPGTPNVGSGPEPVAFV